jgi:hypothetical protein
MPLAWRHLIGMLAAAVAPALAAGLLTALSGPGYLVGPTIAAAFLVAAMHVTILAMPLFPLLARLWEPVLWRVLLASFAIGVGPMALVSAAGSIANGLPDAQGLSVFLAAAAAFGGFGMAGGLAFWLTLAALGAGKAEPAP